MSGAGDGVHEGGSRRGRGHPCAARFRDVGRALARAAAGVREPGLRERAGRLSCRVVGKSRIPCDLR